MDFAYSSQHITALGAQSCVLIAPVACASSRLDGCQAAGARRTTLPFGNDSKHIRHFF
jgi:hypothetical protein